MERTYALKKEYLSCATEKLDKKRLYLFYDSIIDCCNMCMVTQ